MFDELCQHANLPPRSPKYNGGVERSNRTFREEFYAKRTLTADSIGEMRFELKKAVDKYNTYRPHQAIDFRTPFEYINELNGHASQSNML